MQRDFVDISGDLHLMLQITAHVRPYRPQREAGAGPAVGPAMPGSGLDGLQRRSMCRASGDPQRPAGAARGQGPDKRVDLGGGP